MRQRPRIYYTESQKALMWERWQKGDYLQQIAQLFDRNHSSVQGILVQTGGIRPAQRHRSRLALTLAEREEISRAVVRVRKCARRSPRQLDPQLDSTSRSIRASNRTVCCQTSQGSWSQRGSLRGG
jgi:hypothetical protein